MLLPYYLANLFLLYPVLPVILVLSFCIPHFPLIPCPVFSFTVLLSSILIPYFFNLTYSFISCPSLHSCPLLLHSSLSPILAFPSPFFFPFFNSPTLFFFFFHLAYSFQFLSFPLPTPIVHPACLVYLCPPFAFRTVDNNSSYYHLRP